VPVKNYDRRHDRWMAGGASFTANATSPLAASSNRPFQEYTLKKTARLAEMKVSREATVLERVKLMIDRSLFRLWTRSVVIVPPHITTRVSE